MRPSRLTSLTLCRIPARAGPKPYSSSPLADHLLSAALQQAIRTPHCRSDGGNIPSLPSDIPESAVLRLLRLRSLSLDSKVALFRLLPSPSSSSVSVLLHSLSHAGRLSDLADLLRLALSSSTVDPSAFSSALSAFIRAGRYDLAVAALDGAVSLIDTTAAASDVVIALLHKSQLNLALPLFQNLLSSPAPLRPRTCNQLLLSLRKSGMRDHFCNLFDEMSKRGYPFDARGYNICIHSFGKWGQLTTALRLFNQMKSKDLCTYNSMIAALCAGGRLAHALAAYEDIKKGSGLQPDRFTFQNLILGCCKSYRVDEALRLFDEMECGGVRAETLTYNTLLDGLLKVGRLSDACKVFEKMIADGVRASGYSHNIIIHGLFRNGRPAAAFALFSELKKRGHFVDAITFSIVVSSLCKDGRISEALGLVKEMEDRGFAVDLVTITSLLIGLHRNERWDSAERLVKHVRDNVLLPGVLRWKAAMEVSLSAPQDKEKDFTSLFPCTGSLRDVIGLIDHAPEEGNAGEPSDDGWSASPYLDRLAENFVAFGDGSQFFTPRRGRRVRGIGIDSFDADMMNTYLSIFLSNGKLSVACKLFETFISLGRSEPEGYTYNSLLSSFVKRGYLKDAWGIVQDMRDRNCPADIATFNLIIQGLSRMGEVDLACSILDRLTKNGGYLDIVLYNTVIHALGKAGRVEEANGLFLNMTEAGINPDVVTFNILIEVNSKAGKVKEAYKFLRKMLSAGCMPNHFTDTALDFLEKEIEKARLHESSSVRRNDGRQTDDVQ